MSTDAQFETRVVRLIDLNLTLQTRNDLRHSAIADYATRYKNDEPMDPPVVFDVNGVLYLVDGFHREAAHRILNRPTMVCQVTKGSKWEAIQYGLKANLNHIGERPNRADREHAAKMVLCERPQLSDSGIAKMVGVSNKTVSTYRAALEATCEIPKLETRVGLDGKERPATMPSAPVDVANTVPIEPPSITAEKIERELPVAQPIQSEERALDSTETISDQDSPQESEPRRTLKKPLAELILDAQKRLGFFAKAADELKPADLFRYQRLREWIVGAGVDLQEWSKAA
jgi:hypothetical protein